MFNLLRHYAITSFISILVAVVLLAGFYRHLEVQETIELTRKSDLAFSENAIKVLLPQLGEHLKSVANLSATEISRVSFPVALGTAITELTGETSVVRVTIYNNRGVVVFSTRYDQFGRVEESKPGFVSAQSGKSFSDLVYRDRFSLFAPRTEVDNLLQSYVPVRSSRDGPILGVIVTYTDLTALVAQNDGELIRAIAGIASIMLLLYGVLFFTVRRARTIVETQQATIRDRTETLEILSAQLLKNEEKDKEKLATDLHEDLAQTLSAIKIRIENSLGPKRANALSREALGSAVSALQGVIEELQQTAMELRPPSLEELGLLPTIRWFCREFENVHAGIRIEQKISVQEEQVPAPLRIVIYRIIESALNEIARYGHTNQVRLALRLTADAITVAIEYIPHAPSLAGPASRGPAAGPLKRFVIAQERTTHSGGTFLTAQNNDGEIALQAYWPHSVEFVRSQSRRRHDPASVGGVTHLGDQISPPVGAQIRPEAA